MMSLSAVQMGEVGQVLLNLLLAVLSTVGALAVSYLKQMSQAEAQTRLQSALSTKHDLAWYAVNTARQLTGETDQKRYEKAADLLVSLAAGVGLTVTETEAEALIMALAQSIHDSLPAAPPVQGDSDGASGAVAGAGMIDSRGTGFAVVPGAVRAAMGRSWT